MRAKSINPCWWWQCRRGRRVLRDRAVMQGMVLLNFSMIMQYVPFLEVGQRILAHGRTGCEVHADLGGGCSGSGERTVDCCTTWNKAGTIVYRLVVCDQDTRRNRWSTPSGAGFKLRLEGRGVGAGVHRYGIHPLSGGRPGTIRAEGTTNVTWTGHLSGRVAFRYNQ